MIMRNRGISLVIAILLSSLEMSVRAAEPEAATKSGFQFQDVNDRSLALSENGHPVLVYNYGLIPMPGGPDNEARASYVHPLYGLDGELLTDDFPKDHIHHRGMYWAWPHIQVGDQEFSLWGLNNIRIDFVRWLTKEATPDGATMALQNAWIAGGKKIVDEQVQFLVHPAVGDTRAIDLELTWTPVEPITLRGAEGKSYGGFNLRFAPRTKTLITVPSGRTTEDLVMTKLPWADFSADFQGAKDLSGAAIFVSPGHPDYPPTWMTRNYGMLAVGWPGVDSQTFVAGKPIVCRYRVWIHRGAPEAAEIQKAYDDFAGAQKPRS